jgi:hypothetical protein
MKACLQALVQNSKSVLYLVFVAALPPQTPDTNNIFYRSLLSRQGGKRPAKG